MQGASWPSVRVRLGDLANWERIGLQNRHEWVRLPRSPFVMTITEHDTHSLRRWNIWLVVLHAAQGIAILALSTAFILPVIIPFMSGPPGSPIGGFEPVWDLPLASFVAIFPSAQSVRKRRHCSTAVLVSESGIGVGTSTFEYRLTNKSSWSLSSETE